MDEHQRQSRINWGSIIGWLIFFAVIGGGPLLNALQSALGGRVSLSPGLLPFVILGLVMLGALVSMIRSINRRRESDATIDRSSQAAHSPFPSTYQPSTYDDDETPMPQSARSPFPLSYQSPTSFDASSQPRSVRPPFPASTPDLEWRDSRLRRMSMSDDYSLPSAPRFDPIISPLGVVVGVVGLIALIGVALYVFGVAP